MWCDSKRSHISSSLPSRLMDSTDMYGSYYSCWHSLSSPFLRPRNVQLSTAPYWSIQHSLRGIVWGDQKTFTTKHAYIFVKGCINAPGTTWFGLHQCFLRPVQETHSTYLCRTSHHELNWVSRKRNAKCAMLCIPMMALEHHWFERLGNMTNYCFTFIHFSIAIAFS